MRPITPKKAEGSVPDVSLFLLSAARAAKSRRTPSPSSPKEGKNTACKGQKQHSPHGHHSGRISQESLSEGVRYRAGGLGETLECLRAKMRQRKLSQEDRGHEIQRILASVGDFAPPEDAKPHTAPTAVTVEAEEDEIRTHDCCEACLIL